MRIPESLRGLGGRMMTIVLAGMCCCLMSCDASRPDQSGTAADQAAEAIILGRPINDILTHCQSIDDFDAPLSSGDTLLIKAVAYDREGVASYLIDHGADVNQRNAGQMYPLLTAVYTENDSMVELLLEKGADPRARGQRGYTFFHDAVLVVPPGSATWPFLHLMKEEDFDIYLDCALRSTDQVSRRIAEDPNAYRRRDGYGRTPLFFAVVGRRSDTAELLLNAGADMNAKGIDGWSPLMVAADAEPSDAPSRESLLEVLLRFRGDANATGNHGKSLLHYAVQAGRVRNVETLLREGAFPGKEDEAGRTPMDYAKEASAEEGKRMEIMNLLDRAIELEKKQK